MTRFYIAQRILAISFVCLILLDPCFPNTDTDKKDHNHGQDDNDEKIQLQKKRIPEGKDLIPQGDEFCTFSEEKTPKATPTVCYKNTGASESPCQVKCMAPWKALIGHQCDPYLYRFLRRAWDDIEPSKRSWMNGNLLGKRINDKDADFEYKTGSHCGFYCPYRMCMSVIQHENTNITTQWVDMVMLDCVHNDVINRYLGVCTCGHQWSLVDPVNSGRLLNNKTLLVEYNRTIGLDRRLVYDQAAKRCAAERYGHCSFQWPPQYNNYITVCLSGVDIECVNRTANYLGTAYRNFKTKVGLWYGICDSKFVIEDPFAEGRSSNGHSVTPRLSFASMLSLYVLYAIIVKQLQSQNRNIYELTFNKYTS